MQSGFFIKSGNSLIKFRSRPLHITRADLMLNEKLIGNVNIDDRIFTPGVVVTLAKNKYKISPFPINDYSEFSSFVPEASTGEIITDNNGKSYQVITATVDGFEYKGTEIIVDNKIVYVDGKKVTDPAIGLSESKEAVISARTPGPGK